MEPLKLYTTSVTSNATVRHNQLQMKSVLDSKKFAYKEIDVAEMEKEDRDKMVEGITCRPGEERKGMPLMPQLFRGSVYIGNYEDFMNAVEAENIKGFLKEPDAELCQQQAQS